MKHNNPITGVGLGLRNPHLKEVLTSAPKVPWWEVHTENFFSTGAAASQLLHQLAERAPLSAHCVGLSLGSADGVNAQHLAQVKQFVERYQPALISDHVSWSGTSQHYAPDLLPVPYTEEALTLLTRNITHVQEVLGRQIAVENPSSYLTFDASHITEWQFMAELATQANCNILLDINNIYVSCHNHGWDAQTYLQAIPADKVTEIHLAGFSTQEVAGQTMLIDTHSAPVHDGVWALFEQAVVRFPHAPVLIEWDNDLPPLARLLEERTKAESIRNRVLQAQAA